MPFEREKIKRGLERACWKRPISTRQIETTTTAIENDVYQHFDSEVESRELGEIVMRYLRDLDAVAFVRFASVYRQFNDVYDFFEELRPMLEREPQAAEVRMRMRDAVDSDSEISSTPYPASCTVTFSEPGQHPRASLEYDAQFAAADHRVPGR